MPPSRNAIDIDLPPTSGSIWRPSARERAVLFDTGRLTALYEADLLDAHAPDDLQRLTSLLARQLQSSMASLTIVDADRQYFLASVGLPEMLAVPRQTSIDGSICKHVMLDGETLAIPELARDQRCASREAASLMSLGSYLGAPIVTSSGLAIGALCVMEHEPREWTAADVAAVADFASIARELIEARLARVHSQKERAEKLDILTRITEGFVTLDRSWRVRFVNATAAALARRTPAEAEGRTLWELIPPLESSEFGRWLRARMEQGGVHEREWEGIANPGWFEVRAVVSYEGMSLYLRDITERKRTELALAESEARLREVNHRFQHALSGSDIGMWDWDVPSGNVHFNDRIPAMLGYGVEEFPAHVDAWMQRIHPDDRDDLNAKLAAHLEGATSFYRGIHRLRTRQGSWRWILAAGAVVQRDAEGKPLRMIGTHVDISESKAAEERFRLLFEKSSQPQLLIDEHGVLDCNEATVGALRCRHKEEIIGRPMQAFFPRRQPDGVNSIEATLVHARAARERQGHRFDFTLRRADGTALPLEVSLDRATYEGRRVFLATWHDLTQQREQERVLREAKEAAETASRAKSEFLARMSHELRSPLNSVIGFSRLLRKTQRQDVSASEAKYLDRIHANGVHLLGVINDILDISRIEAGRVEVERSRVDVAELLRSAVQQLEGQVVGSALQLRLEVATTSAWMETDHQKLRQVVINLVGNAIKFTPSGEVVASLRVTDDGTPLAIEVRDTGVGIPHDRQHAIFEPFEQGDNGPARRFEGTGLGLAISRQLCDLLGYQLTVASTPGRGSTFRIELSGS